MTHLNAQNPGSLREALWVILMKFKVSTPLLTATIEFKQKSIPNLNPKEISSFLSTILKPM